MVITSESLSEISTFWANSYKNIGKIIQMSHDYDKNWAQIPILGYGPRRYQDISSMTYNNPPARDIFDSGLQIFGQLFNTDERSMILINSRKTFQTLEEEYEIQIPVLLRNRIAVIIRTIKQKYRTTMATTAQLFENVSTLQSLVRSKPTGCNPATRLILRSQRDS